MNESIDLTKILKDCPKGTKLYSTIHGEVSLITSNDASLYYKIAVRLNDKTEESFTSEGKLLDKFDGECILFPSKDQRDWSKFTPTWYKKEKFDPKTLKPFDKVLVKRYASVWVANLFSHYGKIIHPDDYNTYLEFITISNGTYRRCIPYNDDTKHLVGTTDEAPEYYRYWKD